jgi:hypothetical protein
MCIQALAGSCLALSTCCSRKSLSARVSGSSRLRDNSIWLSVISSSAKGSLGAAGARGTGASVRAAFAKGAGAGRGEADATSSRGAGAAGAAGAAGCDVCIASLRCRRCASCLASLASAANLLSSILALTIPLSACFLRAILRFASILFASARAHHSG